MNLEQLPIFKELSPYSGRIDTENRWIKLSKLVPWDQMNVIYRKYFDDRKLGVIKNSRLILGLMLGQMLMEQSDRNIIEYFHENLYFQYFCGQDTFVAKTDKSIIHHSLLSKRRKRLGKKYMSQFEQEILLVLKEKGLVKGKKLILDATVFPAKITYPNDVKLLNTVRDYLCKTILTVKNTFDPQKRIRTYRKTAKKLYLSFQKTKKKSKTLIRKTRNKMIRYVKRNIDQLETVLEQAQDLKKWQREQIENKLNIAKEVLAQQIHMATTRGRSVKNRVVSFHCPKVRPIVRGKDGKAVEFGPKAHVGLVDGYAFLDYCDFNAYNEGTLLEDSLKKHEERFERQPETLLADRLYANRDNRSLLKEKEITHSFKPLGKPPDETAPEKQAKRRKYKKMQSDRNHIEAVFGHLKDRFSLNSITWRVPDGETIQIQLGLIAFNLHSALSKV